MTEIYIDAALNEVRKLCKDLSIDDSHGVEHVKRALSYLQPIHEAYVEEGNHKLSDAIYLNIALAIILHDVDDAKFTDTNDYQNAKTILTRIGWTNKDHIAQIVFMISKVSMSINGTEVDPTLEDWIYWPRHADRIDALGYIGIERIYELTANHFHTPMFVESTPILKTAEEVINAAKQCNWVEKSKNSKGLGEKHSKSDSGVDHMIESIIPRTFCTITNKYIKYLYDSQVKIIIDFVIAVSHFRELGGKKIDANDIATFKSTGIIPFKYGRFEVIK